MSADFFIVIDYLHHDSPYCGRLFDTVGDACAEARRAILRADGADAVPPGRYAVAEVHITEVYP